MKKYVVLFAFCIISFILINIGLRCSKKYIKKESTKNLIFIIVSVITVLIHYSGLLYHALTDGVIDIEDNLYLPVYPCNVIMWECTTISFLMTIKKTNTKIFNVFSEFVFYVGSVCAIIGLTANINFLNNPSLKDYDITRGLLSHVTLIFTCLYLNVMGYVKKDALNNLISLTIGFFIFLFCGLYSNVVIDLLGKDPINSMYVREPPFEKYPFINIYTVVPIFLLTYLFIILYNDKKYKKFKKMKKENKLIEVKEN